MLDLRLLFLLRMFRKGKDLREESEKKTFTTSVDASLFPLMWRSDHLQSEQLSPENQAVLEINQAA